MAKAGVDGQDFLYFMDVNMLNISPKTPLKEVYLAQDIVDFGDIKQSNISPKHTRRDVYGPGFSLFWGRKTIEYVPKTPLKKV